MCYSVKTSIFSYTMGMVASIIALSTKQYVLGMLILIYCQIQLAEAMIWRGIDTSNPSFNQLGTLYAKYTLPLHLFFVGIGVYMLTKTWTVAVLGILFYLGVIFFYSNKSWVKDGEHDLSFPSNRACMSRDCQNNENRLQWPFRDDWYVIQTIIMFSVFMVYLPIKSSVLLCTFFTATYFVSSIMVKWSTSSIWCFLSAILAPILVCVNYSI